MAEKSTKKKKSRKPGRKKKTALWEGGQAGQSCTQNAWRGSRAGQWEFLRFPDQIIHGHIFPLPDNIVRTGRCFFYLESVDTVAIIG